MTVPVSSKPFHVLVASLQDGGYSAHADRLESILSGTWTTSSELIGELGAAVVAVRNECSALSAEQEAPVEHCLTEVRKAWPGFGLFSRLPFNR